VAFAFIATLGVALFWGFPWSHPAWITPLSFYATFAASLLALWGKRDWRLAAKVTSVGLVLLAGPVLYPLGGLFSRTAYWACLAAPVGMFLIGRRWGLVCMLLIWLQFGALLALHQSGYPIPDARTPPAHILVVILTLFALATLVIGWIFETSRENSEHALVTSMRQQQELEVAKNAAELANQTRTAFMATISHELRTPLNTIIGYSELLIEEAEDDPGLATYTPEVDAIRHAGDHLLGLVDDILILLMLDSGDSAPSLETTRLSAITDRLRERFTPRAAARGNTLRVSLDPDDLTLETDPRRLTLCLSHLLDNACKFTQGGLITLTATRDDAGVHLEVEDTGVGIDPDLHDAVFERFAQADGSLGRAADGTGLGLAITRELAATIGGHVTLDSAPGQGSRFRLSFPAG
jgi:signal transduction histidine kinase